MSQFHNSRRSFVVGGIATVAGLSVAGCGGGDGGSGTVTSAAPVPTAALPPLITREVGDWEGLVGSIFRITGDHGPVQATLAALERGAADANRPGNLARSQPFVAIFEMATSTAPAGNQTYSVSHANRGNFDLFLGQPSTVRGMDVMVAILN